MKKSEISWTVDILGENSRTDVLQHSWREHPRAHYEKYLLLNGIPKLVAQRSRVLTSEGLHILSVLAGGNSAPVTNIGFRHYFGTDSHIFPHFSKALRFKSLPRCTIINQVDFFLQPLYTWATRFV